MAYITDDEGRVFYVDPETGEQTRVRSGGMDAYANYQALPADIQNNYTSQELQNWGQIQATAGNDILSRYWNLGALSSQPYSFGVPQQYVQSVDNYSNYDPAQQIVLMETSGYAVPREAVKDQAVWDRAHDPVFRQQVTDAAMKTMNDRSELSSLGMLASVAAPFVLPQIPGVGDLLSSVTGSGAGVPSTVTSDMLGNAPGILGADAGFLPVAADAANATAASSGLGGLDVLGGAVGDSALGAGVTLDPGLFGAVPLEGLGAGYGGIGDIIGSSVTPAAGTDTMPSFDGEGYGGASGQVTNDAFGNTTVPGGYSGSGTATAGASASSALGRILNGTATLDDYLQAGGTALGAGLNYLQNSNIADALKQTADQQWNAGSWARDLNKASYEPGFNLYDQPGYGDAFQRAADVAARSYASRYGNPSENPTAQAGILNNVWSGSYLPALSNYRGGLMQAGQLGLNTSGVLGAQAAQGAGSGWDALGYAAGQLTTPQNNIQDMLRLLNGQNFTLKF